MWFINVGVKCYVEGIILVLFEKEKTYVVWILSGAARLGGKVSFTGGLEESEA